MVVHHEAKQSDHAVATRKTAESGAGSTTLGTTAAEAQEKSGSLVLHVCKRSQQQKDITGGFSMVESGRVLNLRSQTCAFPEGEIFEGND